MRLMVCAVVTGLLCASAHGLTMLYFESEPGSFVGQGETWRVTPEDGYEFRILNTYGNGINIFVDNFATAPSADEHNWTLQLFPITGDTLVVGEYANAERFASPTNPGMDFYGDGRGYNETEGFYEILEIEFDGDGKVTKLAADFTQ